MWTVREVSSKTFHFLTHNYGFCLHQAYLGLVAYEAHGVYRYAAGALFASITMHAVYKLYRVHLLPNGESETTDRLADIAEKLEELTVDG